MSYCDTFISSMFHQALMFRETGNYYESLRLLTRVQSHLTDDKTVYIQRGKVYMDMQNFVLAIKDFQQAIEIDQHCYEAFF